MKIVTFVRPSEETPVGVLGVLVDASIIDLPGAAAARGRGSDELVHNIDSLLAGGALAKQAVGELTDWASTSGYDGRHHVDSVRLLAPIPRPPNVFCLASNYEEHVRESGRTSPPKAESNPRFFLKPSTCIVGHGAKIELPELAKGVDYEGELAVVVGRRAREVRPGEALRHVAGYVNFNDVSARGLYKSYRRASTEIEKYFDWLNGKGFDTFGPMGPYLAVDEIDDPNDILLTTRVNGELRQSGSTGDMIFDVPEIISWLSRFVTLQPGDIIATGTPAGVGKATDQYLREGDEVEVELSGLGVLRNTVGNCRATR